MSDSKSQTRSDVTSPSNTLVQPLVELESSPLARDLRLVHSIITRGLEIGSIHSFYISIQRDRGTSGRYG